MLSRVADSIYWMSRYIERAENVARFIDVNLHLMLDLPSGFDDQWHPLVSTTGDHDIFEERYGPASRKNVIEFLTFDRANLNSIISCARAARENARSVREIISSEMWEQVNKLYLTVNEEAADGWTIEELHDFFTQIKLAGHLFAGITDATMSHGEAWSFVHLGRMLERADKTSRILDVKYFILLPTVTDVGTPYDDIQWAAVLRSASAFEMYRKTYGRITPDQVVDFLLLDYHFPRAIRYCIVKADEALHAISGTPVGTFSNLAEQRLGHLRSDLAYTKVQEVLSSGLHEFLDALQTKLNRVGDGIHEDFFAPRPLASKVAYRQQ
ncbi:MAG: alpha-E domain-containing protein [Acidobacteriota bacterium]